MYSLQTYLIQRIRQLIVVDSVANFIPDVEYEIIFERKHDEKEKNEKAKMNVDSKKTCIEPEINEKPVRSLRTSKLSKNKKNSENLEHENRKDNYKVHTFENFYPYCSAHTR